MTVVPDIRAMSRQARRRQRPASAAAVPLTKVDIVEGWSSHGPRIPGFMASSATKVATSEK
jgi:hypothetical protein